MSQSPIDAREEGTARDRYLDNWNRLARRIREGASFSGRERNCGFLNTGATRFADVSGALGLDWPDDGRGLAVVDWDQDGDLDFWLANRTGPSVRFLENRLGRDAGYLALQLQGVTGNRDAIGARVEVRLAGDTKRHVRSLRAGEGFLSQSSKVVHFGLGVNARIEEVTVTWPGNPTPQRFTRLSPNQRYRLVEGQAEAIPLPARASLAWDERLRDRHDHEAAELSGERTRRVLLTQRRSLPPLQYVDGDGRRVDLRNAGRQRPLLLNLWASWCAPCLQEMQELAAARDRLASRLDIVAVSVDALPGAGPSGVEVGEAAVEPAGGEAPGEAARARVRQLAWPYDWGLITQESLRAWTEFDHEVFYRTRTLPLPCSLLVDTEGRVAAIYKGPLTISQLEADVQGLAGDAVAWREAASPFGGKSIASWFSPDRAHIAQAYLEGGYRDDARRELDRFFAEPPEAGRGAKSLRVLAWRLRNELAVQDADAGGRLVALREIVREQPESLADRAELAVVCHQQGAKADAEVEMAILGKAAQSRPEAAAMLVQTRLRMDDAPGAEAALGEALRRFPSEPRLRYIAAMSALGRGEPARAIALLRALVAERPEALDAANDLAWLLAEKSDPGEPSPADDLQAALALAERIVAASQREEPQFLDTLARVRARRGEWEQAAAVAEEARRLAVGRGDDLLSHKLQRRRDDYHRQRIGD